MDDLNNAVPGRALGETGLCVGLTVHKADRVGNRLSWPFPMYGKSMQPSARMLGQAVFALL